MRKTTILFAWSKLHSVGGLGYGAPSSRSIKKDLLRQAVEENIHTQQGRPAPKAIPLRPRRFRPVGLVMVAVVLLAVSYLVPLALGVDGQLVPVAVSTSPAGLVGGKVSPPQASLPPRVLAAPTPIDSAVFPVGVHRIVLDPGHGGRDVGTITPDGLYEKDLALDIALRLRRLLEEDTSREVLMTRSSDHQVLLKDRAKFANDAKADLFVSIHVNWLVPRTNRGVETFYLGPTEEPYLVRLTSRENRESGYSLADVRRLLDGIYLDLRQKESKALAESVQHALYGSLVRENPELRDRGVKPAPFLVLVATDMPAILAEVSCLSNRKEAKLLATKSYRQRIAEALYSGLESYVNNLSHSHTNQITGS